jgi:flagellar motor switch protein FliN
MKENIDLKVNDSKENTRVVSLTDINEQGSVTGKSIDADYSVVSDVKVSLEAYVGSTDITIKELFDLNLGSVVALNESVESPLTLKLDGKPVANGLLVVVGDNFGIKVTEIIKSNTKVM